MLPVSLLSFQQSGFTQVLKSSANSRLRQLELTGNGRDCRPAFAVLIRTIQKIDIDGLRSVRKIHPVQKIKSAHQKPPSGQVPAPVQQSPACVMAENRLSCRPFRFDREEASVVCFCSDCFWEADGSLLPSALVLPSRCLQR